MKETANILPVLPIRDMVLFPSIVAPLVVGRDKSIKAIQNAMAKDGKIILLTQKASLNEQPKAKDLHKIGLLGTIIQLIRLPDGKIKLLVQGEKIIKTTHLYDEFGFYETEYEEVQFKGDFQNSGEALARACVNSFETYQLLNKKINPEIIVKLKELDELDKIIYAIAAHMPIRVSAKQKLLEEQDLPKFMQRLNKYIQQEIEVINLEKNIHQQVDSQIRKKQRDYFLKEQRDVIDKELGVNEDSKTELEDLEKKVTAAKISKEAKDKALSELKRLKQMGPMSPETSIIRNYIDLILALPWDDNAVINKDIKLAQKILDEDHFGMEKAKERIIEYLAVQSRSEITKGNVICFVGPPGVGKTSLAKSIAKATNRPFIRISLGGMKDESEIRGHRRTYIGALPGKILQAMKKAKKSNPVILLDEIDKVGMEYRGDPAAALLEVLDPEQNKEFMDNYLEVGFDLSKVMFIATANSLDITHALLDRMEVISLSGYTENEKLNIAKKYLLEKVKLDNGLNPTELSITDNALLDVIRYHTYESGVRSLERRLSKLARKVLKENLEGEPKAVRITSLNLEKYLGVRKYDYGRKNETDLIGVSTGLAYTDLGGEILNIETVLVPGKGNIQITGKLGEVMQESVQAAFTYFKSQAKEYNIEAKIFEETDVHLHVPEGATPKDGPSAGIAIFTSLYSAFTKQSVKNDVAMTGEITITGRVLEIGGLKEKLLAAVRAKILTALIPHSNLKDLKELPEYLLSEITIYPIKNASEVLDFAVNRSQNDAKWQKSDIEVDFTAENHEKSFVTH